MTRRREDGHGSGLHGRAGAVAAAGLLLAACGGGGGGGGAASGGDGATLTGTATKGPLAGATVTAFAVSNGAKGEQLATSRTDARGRFTMRLGTSSGPVLVEVHGGSYVDEATGATMAMGAGDVMAAALPELDPASAATVQVTPLTSMAEAMAQTMPGGMTAENVAAANADVGRYFSAGDVLHTPPMDPLAPGAGAGASPEERNHGMTVAAMSQLARDLGMPASSGMVTAMMDDASDGVMDGMMGSTPISMGGMGGMMDGGRMPAAAGTSRLADAMEEFVRSGSNRSGVTPEDMRALMDRLSTASGRIR